MEIDKLKQNLLRKNEVFLIIFIMSVASALSFYHFFQIPFIHDEFSAIFRTHFASFGELVEKGVKV